MSPASGGNEQRPSFWALRRDIVEATDDNFLPSVGGIVHSKMHGKCKVEAVRQRVSSTKLLRYIMTTPYSEISCLEIHRVVHSYLRCTVLALPSESLAECVGSVLADAAQKATGKPKEVNAFIQAAIIRLAGLRGHGVEEGILADALNTHFKGGVESWKFKTKLPASGGRVVHKKIEMQQKTRIQHCQPWVSAPLLDVIRGSGIRPCKKLPGPEHFYCSKLPSKLSTAAGVKRPCAEDSARGEQPPCKRRLVVGQHRRDSLKIWRDEHKPSILPQALWRCMNANTRSIGSDLLPGERFR